VGDLVRVQENGFFPADMIVINSSEPEGSFYVETKNLDGESNLKLKAVAKDLIDHFEAEGSFNDLSNLTLNIEQPNIRIYKFDGNCCIDEKCVPLSNDSVVLRGMSLRNTEYVTGLVAYTGHDSKI